MGLLKKILFVTLRVWKYQFLSDCKNSIGKPKCFHPLLIKGNGTISFGKNVQIGVVASPNYYSHYTYLEARNESSSIHIGDNVTINNAFSAVAFSKIIIGNATLIGVNCVIMDNDGHNLHPQERNSTTIPTEDILIGSNVFIGDNVTILKGVSIGANTVIGSGSVVTNNIPENTIAAGVPAKVIRNL
ncbi:acyltransferase [Flavobacterium sp.]|jgi:galactoside O-acetyltransferase|uniref:acyltransferase n=1 Tax=Flavobacterium sp. TaxID=239 RepID=UPI0037BFF4E2